MRQLGILFMALAFPVGALAATSLFTGGNHWQAGSVGAPSRGGDSQVTVRVGVDGIGGTKEYHTGTASVSLEGNESAEEKADALADALSDMDGEAGYAVSASSHGNTLAVTSNQSGPGVVRVSTADTTGEAERWSTQNNVKESPPGDDPTTLPYHVNGPRRDVFFTFIGNPTEPGMLGFGVEGLEWVESVDGVKSLSEELAEAVIGANQMQGLPYNAWFDQLSPTCVVLYGTSAYTQYVEFDAPGILGSASGGWPDD